jgi:hypothetical protein
MTGKILSLFSGFVKRTMSGIEPDIVLHDSLDLGEYGIRGRVIATPLRGWTKPLSIGGSHSPPIQPHFSPRLPLRFGQITLIRQKPALLF